MTRKEALGRLLELEDYFCRCFADAPMESEEEAEAYKHARNIKEAILLLSQEEADAEALSVAAATSPPEGETRGEAAGWISVEDRPPDAAGYECLVCAVNENTHQTHVFTAFTGYGEPGWWTSNVHYMSRAKSPRDNKLHSALRVTHWMPLPEMPEEYKNEND